MHDQEGRTITVHFETFILVTAYVPHSGCAAEEKLLRFEYRTTKWDVDFRNYLKELVDKEGKPVILGGDLNVCRAPIDYHNPKGKHKDPCFTDEERGNFEKLLETGFEDSFRALNPNLVKFT